MFKIAPLSVLIAMSVPVSVLADHVDLPSMAVTGTTGEMVPYALPETAISSPDSGDLLTRLPGANINRNGPLTSIAQYRGLFGDRVNVLIDGVQISQAGPNRMDSPLSYLPGSRVESITLYRGIAPVSTGIETIGGSISATSKQASFAMGEETEIHGNAATGYATNGDSRYGSVMTSVANQNHLLKLSGSLERGHSLEFRNGDVLPTEHERDTVGLGYAFQRDGNQLEFDVEHHDTGNTGTPALPMDIIFARGENYKVRFSKEFTTDTNFSMQLNYQDAEHEMDNYTLRTNLNPSRFRYTLADVKAHGIKLAYQQANWTFGFDADQADHNATIYNPNNTSFYLDNYNDVERDRYSTFAEWRGNIARGITLDSGLRVTRVNMDAGRVNSSMMGAAMTLANNFNDADRSQSDNLVDLAATFTKTLSDQLDLEWGLARKQRAPSYQERYLWATMESTSGLADGNNYVGDINLDPETAYQFELGLDWHTSKAGMSPRVFYHHINDYIQGVAATDATVIALSTMMGDGTPLQFSNVDAKLYGLDANWFLTLNNAWQLDGTVSYVQGKRRDTNDNLYRVAPLSARTMLSYQQAEWKFGVEAVTVAAQNKVSSENEEQKTAGYTTFNLSAQYQPSSVLSLHAGINNLFDRDYQNHLGGYNRISDNPDIDQGERLPGLGRSIFVGMNLNW